MGDDRGPCSARAGVSAVSGGMRGDPRRFGGAARVAGRCAEGTGRSGSSGARAPFAERGSERATRRRAPPAWAARRRGARDHSDAPRGVRVDSGYPRFPGRGRSCGLSTASPRRRRGSSSSLSVRFPVRVDSGRIPASPRSTHLRDATAIFVGRRIRGLPHRGLDGPPPLVRVRLPGPLSYRPTRGGAQLLRAAPARRGRRARPPSDTAIGRARFETSPATESAAGRGS